MLSRDSNNSRTWFLDIGTLRIILDLSPGHTPWPVHLSR
jgi:hypothetical protein